MAIRRRNNIKGIRQDHKSLELVMQYIRKSRSHLDFSEMMYEENHRNSKI